jgi:uncharacterized membrane protein YhaH (DUF805 family)
MRIWRATKTCIRKSFVLSGRASRGENWWFLLGPGLLLFLARISDLLLFGTEAKMLILSVVFGIVTYFATFTAGWRRLQDIGLHGSFSFLPLLTCALGIAVGAIIGVTLGQAGPILAGITMISGPLLLLYWMLSPSQPETNKYGPNPLEVPS